jgi:hypothetical protein
MENSIIWLVKLLLAHFISDFFLQKSSWVDSRDLKKFRSPFLYLHILITALTALAFTGPDYWEIVIIIAVTHYIIDLAKAYLPKNFRFFILDQAAHIAVILACWAYTFDFFPSWKALSDFYYRDKFWIVAACVVFLTYPSGYIIANATKYWSDQVVNLNAGNSGLVSAGKYIGIVERLIICILVYYSQYEAIGLLITGKSILRYNSANEEIKTEYLLVGTLISIFIAFAVGLLLKYLLVSV